MKTLWRFASLLAVIAANAVPVLAQSYPDRPIRLVVGFPPGGNADLSARMAAAKMSEALGTAIVVDNRGGAAGIVAAQIVARAPADGYTLLWSSPGALVISQIMETNPPYKTETAFAPISLAFTFCNALIVRPDFPARTVADLLALAKQKPGQLDFATQGVGSAGHLSGQMLVSVTGVKLTHVPYKGGPAVVTAVASGEVPMGFAATPTAAAIRDRVRVLAVTSRERDPSLPDIPSMQEAGVSGYDATFWFGLLAPAGTPGPIIQRINTLLRDALNDAATTRAARSNGLNPVPSSPRELAVLLKTEQERWRKVISIQ